MKREFLEGLDLGGGAKLTKEAIEAIMAEHGKAKTALDNQVSALTTERDTLKTQLGEANEAIKGFEKLDIDGIKAKANEWESKYNTDMQTLKDQLAAKEYGFSVKEAASGLKFSSESARKAFVADLTAKKLPVQDGKLLGLEDFVKAYQADDPNAFEPDGSEPAPRVVGKTSGGNTASPGAALRAAFGLPATEKE
ncbi:phage scaffolding protein [Intestinibacillus massiliensis]|uniref:phage scaffolding protein n=1 Tax=Intestinibacillus massiliensis TaxID=1871029 RepID=UPI000B35FF41|nr:phage scaffolding protein [Intestinibacillus massiliensis]